MPKLLQAAGANQVALTLRDSCSQVLPYLSVANNLSLSCVGTGHSTRTGAPSRKTNAHGLAWTVIWPIVATAAVGTGEPSATAEAFACGV